MQIAEAGEREVRRFFDHLSRAASEYLNRNDVEAVDVFMASHNIHIWLLLGIEQSLNLDNEAKLNLRRMAIDTLQLYLEQKP